MSAASRGLLRRAPLTVDQAIRLAVLGTLADVRLALRECVRGSATAEVLRAALAQRGGDVAEAERILTRLARRLSERERVAIVDLHVPLLISVGEIDRAERIVLEITSDNAGDRAGIAALAAVIAARRGQRDVSAAAAQRARETLVFSDDEFRRATVLGRLSMAAFYRREHVDAMDLGLAAVKAAEGSGFLRVAAVAYSIPYIVAHDVLGDARLALYYAERTAIVARAAGDESMLAHGLASQAIVAAESGNRRRLESVARRMIVGRRPRQFQEQFVAALALAIPLAWDGKFDQFGAVVTAIRENRNASERSLCDALLGVCALVRGDVHEARRRARVAIHSSRPDARVPAYDDQRRRVARSIAAVVCTRIGDTVRARRVLATKDLAGTPEASLALEHPVATIVEGYRIILEAAARATRTAPVAPLLTPAQMVLLRELALGKTIPEIAREVRRSVTTLRTHAQQINDRLGVRGRAAAIARARELGLL